ncbi:hypothetical protein AUP68_09352 [Ilyonectria robusta]
MTLAHREQRVIPSHVLAPSPTTRCARTLPDIFSPDVRAAIDTLNSRQMEQQQTIFRDGLLGLDSPNTDTPVLQNTYPYYEYWFWSADHPGKPGSPGYIPMLSGLGRDGELLSLPQDIIFSISIQGDSRPGTYKIKFVDIKLDLGPPPKGMKSASSSPRESSTTKPAIVPGALTDRNADCGGPRASMLSNLRFNPRLSYSADGRYMTVTLLPRGASHVPANLAREMSFMLSGVCVNIAPPGIDQVVVSPYISIQYDGWGLQGPTQRPPPHMILSRDSQPDFSSCPNWIQVIRVVPAAEEPSKPNASKE